MARGGRTSAPKAPTKVVDKVEPKMDLSKEDFSSVAVQAKVQNMSKEDLIKNYLRTKKIGMENRSREENKLFYWTYARLGKDGMIKNFSLKSEYLPEKK